MTAKIDVLREPGGPIPVGPLVRLPSVRIPLLSPSRPEEDLEEEEEERHEGADEAHEQPLHDERPPHVMVRGAHEPHDLDLLGPGHHRHPDRVHDDEEDGYPHEREDGDPDRAQHRGDRDEPVDAAALVLQLLHGLAERAALDPDEVRDGHAHVGEEHLAEVPVRGHVGDGPHLDAGRVHRHDDLGDAGVGRPVGAGPTDQVAVVGDLAERGPDLLPVDHPLVALAHRRRLETREVAARVRLAHADAPQIGRAHV